MCVSKCMCVRFNVFVSVCLSVFECNAVCISMSIHVNVCDVSLSMCVCCVQAMDILTHFFLMLGI